MKKNIVVITGAGISAESGISTYRDKDGLWQVNNHDEVASLAAWKKDRAKVLDFWNARRETIETAQPNQAHYSLVKLEAYANVTIITQNIDDFHERAGSSNILHLHGEITKARSSVDRKLIYELNGKSISIGDRCAKNSQLRPHVVWFNEYVPLFAEAYNITKTADILLVVGCSLKVYPAAYLVEKRPSSIPMFAVNPDLELENEYYIKESASVGCEKVVNHLIEKYI